jgi:hypothetical protein
MRETKGELYALRTEQPNKKYENHSRGGRPGSSRLQGGLRVGLRPCLCCNASASLTRLRVLDLDLLGQMRGQRLGRRVAVAATARRAADRREWQRRVGCAVGCWRAHRRVSDSRRSARSRSTDHRPYAAARSQPAPARPCRSASWSWSSRSYPWSAAARTSASPPASTRGVGSA